jgi:tRNA(Ile)-lysidine synthase
LPQELKLEVGYDSITISNANETILPDWPLLSEEAGTISIAIPGSTRLPNSQWIIEATILPEVENLREDMWNAHFDADSLSGSLSIRPRTSTDRFHPQGMPSNLRLKDWMINVKIPRAVRDRLPLIVSGDQIVWVAGFRVGQPFIVREDSKRIIKLTFRKD